MVDQSDADLKRSAGEILNGVKRTVEVQVVDTSNAYNFQDQTMLGKCACTNCPAACETFSMFLRDFYFFFTFFECRRFSSFD